MMAENTPSKASQRPGIADLAFEVLGGAVTAAALAVALAFGVRWFGDALSGTQGFQDIVRVLLGGLLGVVLGMPVGSAIVARKRGQRFSAMLAFGGSFLGAALSITLPTAVAGSEGSTAVPLVAAVMCALGAVGFGNLKTWMGR